jgi:hypothetical protein
LGTNIKLLSVCGILSVGRARAAQGNAEVARTLPRAAILADTL